MARCEMCGGTVGQGTFRFCGEPCRRAFVEKLRHGTPARPGRTAAHRRRRRGR